MRQIALATIAATLIQVPLYALLLGLAWLQYGYSGRTSALEVMLVVGAVIVVALAHVIFLGLPAFLVLKRLERLTVLALGTVGIVLGALPTALLTFPAQRSTGFTWRENWHGRLVTFVDNGEVTTYGWLSYAENVLVFGFLGLVGAIVFFKVWESQTRRRAHEV